MPFLSEHPSLLRLREKMSFRHVLRLLEHGVEGRSGPSCDDGVSERRTLYPYDYSHATKTATSSYEFARMVEKMTLRRARAVERIAMRMDKNRLPPVVRNIIHHLPAALARRRHGKRVHRRRLSRRV